MWHKVGWDLIRTSASKKTRTQSAKLKPTNGSFSIETKRVRTSRGRRELGHGDIQRPLHGVNCSEQHIYSVAGKHTARTRQLSCVFKLFHAIRIWVLSRREDCLRYAQLLPGPRCSSPSHIVINQGVSHGRVWIGCSHIIQTDS